MENEHIDQKEKLLVENILSESTLLSKVYHILDPSYFSPPLDRVVQFITNYFDQYYNAPSFRQIYAETDVSLEEQEGLEQNDIDYTLDELEKHCQQEAIKKAILNSLDDVEKNNISAIESRIRESLTIKIDNDIGVDYFETSAVLRLSQFQEEVDKTSVGYGKIDELLGGGIGRGDLAIFAGNSGSGKSVLLTNIANNFSIHQEDVLFVSLELNQQLISSRLDSIVTGVPSDYIFDESEAIENAIEVFREERGGIVIKYVPFGTTPSQLRAILLEYQLYKGKWPDVLVLDYIDEMKTGNARVDNDIHEKEGEVTGEISSICQKYGIRGITASQLTKNADDVTKITASFVAGSNAKISRCDYCIGMVSTEEDIDNNEIQFTQIKVRNGIKQTNSKTLFINPSNLRITEKQEESHVQESPLDRLKRKKDNKTNSSPNDAEEEAREKLKDYVKTI